ncbi:MAG: hypothetical protein MZV63_15695 [Marinilabiliales bacterium]|nr:hypothetical protein [Marinilabiliales bacterium]
MLGNYFRKILRASSAVTAAATEVGDWVDVDEYSTVMVWLNVTTFASRNDETLVVTIEREAGNIDGYTTIATFETINSTVSGSNGPGSEEIIVDFELGGRIRYRAVTAGTWSSKSMTYNIQMHAKV